MKSKAVQIKNSKNVILITLVLLSAILFETFQQLFYIKRFDLYQNIDFFELLKNQFYRWVIWFFVGISLLFLIKKDLKQEPDFKLFIKYFLIIVFLVFANIIIISCVQIIISRADFSIDTFFYEYFLFYVFQKAPIYFLGYIAISIILFLNYRKNLLEIEVQELIEIKEINDKLYEELKKENTDKSKVLTIKVGNKRKVISVDLILWLEADDYCVIVHAIGNPSYAMRTSLKALQDKLGDNFLRVHRNAIVNMNMVKELNTIGSPKLTLKNDTEIKVSKSNIRLVSDFLKS